MSSLNETSPYVAYAFQYITLEGWIVLFVLCAFSAVSLAVVIAKLLILHFSAKADRRFLESVRQRGVLSMSAFDLEQKVEASSADKFEQLSSMKRLYLAATQALEQYVTDDGPLSANKLDSIGAVLSSAVTKEAIWLNRKMVILAISVTGGPLIGLLGTVVGVIMTFIAIAQNDQVNIAVIAPGIAAALVATVAGLIVAIPALFAYNIFASIIKQRIQTLRAFCNEIISAIRLEYE